MRGSCGLYPSLGRYFDSKQELADAGCMSRQRLDDCLHGKKQFKVAEMVAIWDYIEAKQRNKLSNVSIAFKFDERFRVKERNNDD